MCQASSIFFFLAALTRTSVQFLTILSILSIASVRLWSFIRISWWKLATFLQWSITRKRTIQYDCLYSRTAHLHSDLAFHSLALISALCSTYLLHFFPVMWIILCLLHHRRRLPTYLSMNCSFSLSIFGQTLLFRNPTDKSNSSLACGSSLSSYISIRPEDDQRGWDGVGWSYEVKTGKHACWCYHRFF